MHPSPTVFLVVGFGDSVRLEVPLTANPTQSTGSAELFVSESKSRFPLPVKISGLSAGPGFAYHLTLQVSWFLSLGQDSQFSPSGSQTVVYEDGLPLPTGHAFYARIVESGQGTYLHWGNSGFPQSVLYFSSRRTTRILSKTAGSYRAVFTVLPSMIAVLVIVGFSIPLYARVYRGLNRIAAFPTRTTIPGPALAGALLAIAIVIVVLPLVTHWWTGRSIYLALGGLLPWSDASGWFSRSIQFLHTEVIPPWGLRRPLHTVFSGGLLFLTGERLQLVLIIRALLAALAIFFLAREALRAYGLVAGVFAFAILASFAQLFGPMLMSEIPGLALGAAGFTLLWQSAESKSLKCYATGLLLLVLAMSVRPGALLVIPLLCLWAPFALAKNRTFEWTPLLVAMGVVVLGFGVSRAFAMLFGAQGGTPGANYGYVLYGLAHGGASWHLFFSEHPELAAMAEADNSAIAVKLALLEIRENPGMFLHGLDEVFRAIHAVFVYVRPWRINPLLHENICTNRNRTGVISDKKPSEFALGSGRARRCRIGSVGLLGLRRLSGLYRNVPNRSNVVCERARAPVRGGARQLAADLRATAVAGIEKRHRAVGVGDNANTVADPTPACRSVSTCHPAV